jgi:phospholipid transport system substrate-binding protein
MKKNLYAFIISFIFLCLFSSPAIAADVMSELKESIQAVIDTIKNKQKATTPEAQAVQRKKIFSIAQSFFNFKEMSKRTLGKEWKQIPKEKQDRFAHLFARFLANIYYKRLEEYTNETVKYLEQRQHKNKLMIKTLVVTQKNEIPMNYKLLKSDRWRVYDISIEGVSLVRNYRSQFHKILRKKGIEELMNMMSQKLGQFSDL